MLNTKASSTLPIIIYIVLKIIGIFCVFFFLVIEGILEFLRHGVFWECFGCYNLLINNNIINTTNYVNIF